MPGSAPCPFLRNTCWLKKADIHQLGREYFVTKKFTDSCLRLCGGTGVVLLIIAVIGWQVAGRKLFLAAFGGPALIMLIIGIAYLIVANRRKK